MDDSDAQMESFEKFHHHSNLSLDTRKSQVLAPVLMPGKLWDRIEKAQRRAAASKDGVSIFSARENISRASTALDLTSSQFDQFGEPSIADYSRVETAPSLELASGLDSKKDHSASTPNLISSTTKVDYLGRRHLPDFVLSYKMRDFEARSSANSMLFDPLDTSFVGLTLEEKESVMQTLHDKIQKIAHNTDIRFADLKHRLDMCGVFDSSANAQRAQAMCLVELQKNCQLDKLRDEAVDEVLARAGKQRRSLLKFVFGGDKANSERDKRGSRNQQRAPLDTKNVLYMEMKKQRRSLSSKNAKKRLPALQQTTSDATQGTSARRGRKKGPRVDTGQKNDPENGNDTLRQVSATCSVSEEQSNRIAIRHPHVANVLEQFHSGAISISVISGRPITSGVNDRNFESSKMQSTDPIAVAVGEWAKRPNGYIEAGARAVELLTQRCEGRRWDSTEHFEWDDEADTELPEALWSRIHDFHDRRLNRTSGNEKGTNNDDTPEETDKERFARIRQEYALAQDRIRSKLENSKMEQKRRLRVRAKESKLRKHVTRQMLGPTVLGKISRIEEHLQSSSHLSSDETRDSTESIARTSSSAHVMTQPGMNNDSLRTSISAPALGAQSLVMTQQERRIGSSKDHVRLDLMDRSQSKRDSRRNRFLIGAPPPFNDCTHGHYSDARIKMRRESAQTWYWDATKKLEPCDSILEEKCGVGDKNRT